MKMELALRAMKIWNTHNAVFPQDREEIIVRGSLNGISRS